MLKVFVIAWGVLLLGTVIFARASIGFKNPDWAQSVPKWVYFLASTAALYGWTIPAALMIAGLVHLMQSRISK